MQPANQNLVFQKVEELFIVIIAENKYNYLMINSVFCHIVVVNIF